MHAATEKQIAYIEGLIRKLRTQPVKASRFCNPESFKRQVASFTGEIEAKLPTMSKNAASAYVGDLIAMSR